MEGGQRVKALRARAIPGAEEIDRAHATGPVSRRWTFMSKVNRWSWASWVGLVLVGCSAGGGGDPGGGEGDGAAATITIERAARPVRALRGGATGAWEIARRASTIPDAVTWTSDGQLALISGKSGAVRQSVAAWGTSLVRDLVVDRWQRRVVVFEQEELAESGEIASYALVPGPSGPLLAPRVHRSWVDGEVRLLASSLGIVAFAESYGTWWKLFFSEGGSVSSVAAPLPASAWIDPIESGIRVQALTISPDLALHRLRADAQWEGVSAPKSASLGVFAAGAVPTARLMPAPARGEAMLFDVVEGALAIRLVNGPSPGPATLVPLGVSALRVEQALPVDGGEVALLLLSGEGRVVALEIDAAGGVSSSAELALPGVVRAEKKLFSHDLALLGPRRALAATSAGVQAIVLGRDAGGVHLSLDSSFAGGALRGPVEALQIEPF